MIKCPHALLHCGVAFFLHDISLVVVSSDLRCAVCKTGYPLHKISAGLDWILNTHSPCRDLVCCQTLVPYPPTGAATLDFLVGVGAGISSTPALESPESPRAPQSVEPPTEREAPVMCRWCKGKREITVNFKTKPCECVKQRHTSVDEGIARLDEQALNESHAKHLGKMNEGRRAKKAFRSGYEQLDPGLGFQALRGGLEDFRGYSGGLRHP